MNAEIKGKPACFVWGVETDEGIMTVRAAAPSYDELLNIIGVAGSAIPMPNDCDGICDILGATPELQRAIEENGIGIRCSVIERDGKCYFDVEI
ncbi:MAG TPA: hypothetical protein O0X27_06925 [Methanocorpusculum sp.]|nr:hypothetical protein [Methanocorpusculum sp.]